MQPPHVRFIDGTTKSTSTSMTTKCRSLEPVAIGAAPPPPLQRAGLVRLFGHPLSPSVIAARLLCGREEAAVVALDATVAQAAS